MLKSAERTNDKLFPIFLKNLSSDNLAEFTTAAEKLSGWLSKDRAYYTKARPMIISLMETALDNVRRHSGSGALFHVSTCTDELKPWAEPYLKIVRTVVPFWLLFPERSLQLRLRKLFQTLCENVDEFLSQQTLVPPPTNPTSTPVAGLLQPPPTPQSAPHSPAVTSHNAGAPSPSPAAPASTPVVSSRLTQDQIKAVIALTLAQGRPIQIAPALPPAVSSTPNSELVAPTPLAEISQPSPIVSNSAGGSPPNPTPSPATPHEPAMDTSAGTSRPKAKKRKTLPLATDFIEADLNWYRDKHAADASASKQDARPSTSDQVSTTNTAQSGADAAVPAITATGNPPVAVEGHTATPPSQDGPPSVLTPVPRARDAPSNPNIAEQTTLESPTLLSPSIARRPSGLDPPAAAETSSAPTINMSAASTSEALPSPLVKKKTKKRKRGPPGLKVLPVLDGETGTYPAFVEQPPTSTPVVSTVPPSVAETEVRSPTVHARTREEAAPPVQSPAPIDVDHSGTFAAPPSVDAVQNEATGTSFPPKDAQTSEDGDVVMREPLNVEASTRTTTEDASASTPTQNVRTTPQSNSAVVPSESAHVQNALRADVDASAPMTDTAAANGVETDPQTPADVDVAEGEMDDSSPFAGVDTRVLSLVRGAPSMTPASRPVILEFELTEEELTQVARWKDRRSKSSDELSTALCISFASYFLSQFIDASQTAGEAPDATYDIASCGRPAPWPRDSTAFVTLNMTESGTGGDQFTIAPPFITTVNNCIDFGAAASLRAGTNTLRLFQYRDHSDRVFAMLLHRPTRAQLAEVRAAHARERAWRQSLDSLGQIELTVPRLFPG